jgi:hypothetical protein
MLTVAFGATRTKRKEAVKNALERGEARTYDTGGSSKTT